MKHHIIKSLAAIALGAMLLTGCDPGYDEEVAVRNTTSHSVTIIPGVQTMQQSVVDTSTYSVQYDTYTVASGETTILQAESGLGGATLEEGHWLFRNYAGDSITFRFDDGRQVVYYAGDTSGISPFNTGSALYNYEEKLNSDGWTFKDNPRFGRLTFTIVEEHYMVASR